jgi:hypothetical protein
MDGHISFLPRSCPEPTDDRVDRLDVSVWWQVGAIVNTDQAGDDGTENGHHPEEDPGRSRRR